jgi:hypothetical protein
MCRQDASRPIDRPPAGWLAGSHILYGKSPWLLYIIVNHSTFRNRQAGASRKCASGLCFSPPPQRRPPLSSCPNQWAGRAGVWAVLKCVIPFGYPQICGLFLGGGGPGWITRQTGHSRCRAPGPPRRPVVHGIATSCSKSPPWAVGQAIRGAPASCFCRGWPL